MISVVPGIIAARRAREEEENRKSILIKKNSENKQWEYKFLRSVFNSFRNSDKLKQAIDMQAKYGWVLDEKVDAGQLLFKRKRENSNNTPEAYQSFYGVSEMEFAAICIAIMVGIAIIIAFYTIFILSPINN